MWRRGQEQPPLFHDSLVGGVGGGLDNLQARATAAAASASVLPAAFTAPSVVPAVAAPITTSTAPSGAPSIAPTTPKGAATAIAPAAAAAAAVTSRVSTTAALRSADGQLAALHSCGGEGSTVDGQKLDRGPACTHPGGSCLHLLSWAASDLQKDILDGSIPISKIFFMLLRDVCTHFHY